MKLVAAILATLTLFLTVQPVMTHQSYVAAKETCTSETCCSDEEDTCEQQDKTEEQKDDPNKCCNNGHCNPFEVCTCCYYISTVRPVFSISNFLTIKEKVRLTNDKILSSYIQDFWHPPEFGCNIKIG